MKKKKIKLAIIGGVLMFASCKKESQVLNPNIDSGGVEVLGDEQHLKTFSTLMKIKLSNHLLLMSSQLN
jgi:hypothetical protein